MAVITLNELVKGRRRLTKKSDVVTWSKSEVNFALQAIEDWYEANKADAITAIEASAPGVFSLEEKRTISRIWVSFKAKKGLV